LGLNQSLALTFCLRLIFSENRFPLFGIILLRRKRERMFRLKNRACA